MFSSSTIPPPLFNMGNLTEIRLNGNALSGIGSEIGGLKSLKVISLENNRIGFIPLEIMELQEIL